MSLECTDEHQATSTLKWADVVVNASVAHEEQQLTRDQAIEDALLLTCVRVIEVAEALLRVDGVPDSVCMLTLQCSIMLLSVVQALLQQVVGEPGHFTLPLYCSEPSCLQILPAVIRIT